MPKRKGFLPNFQLFYFGIKLNMIGMKVTRLEYGKGKTLYEKFDSLTSVLKST